MHTHIFIHTFYMYAIVQSCTCVRFCDPMDCSTPGLSVHHELPEFTQTHVHWVGDAIQPSHPLSSPSPPAFNPSQHQGSFPVSQLFASGGQSTGASASAPALPVNIQGWLVKQQEAGRRREQACGCRGRGQWGMDGWMDGWTTSCSCCLQDG